MDDWLEALVFGIKTEKRWPGLRYEPKRDPLKYLLVSDSKPVDEGSTIFLETKAWVRGRWGIPVWLEALRKNSRTTIQIEVDERGLKIGWNELNGAFKEVLGTSKDFWEFTLEAIKEYYLDLTKEEEKWAKAHGLTSVSEFYSKIRERIQRGEMLLRIGRGKGYLSNTIGLLLKNSTVAQAVLRNYRIGDLNNFPITRRYAILSGRPIPLGWISLA